LPSEWNDPQNRPKIRIVSGDVNDIRVFTSNSTGATAFLGKISNSTTRSYIAIDLSVEKTYYMEALEFRSSSTDNWEIELEATDGVHVVKDRVALRPSPFILLPGSAGVEAAYAPDYVGKTAGGEDQDADIDGLGTTVDVNSSSDYYHDPWLQDAVEIGYTSWPGGAMSVVWDLPRGRDLETWPEDDLLGPDCGVFSYEADDGSGNYGGNIEATAPLSYDGEYRYCGIVVTGSNCSLGGFIEAQGIQPVLACYVGWLSVGHIDETVSFLSSSSVRIADTDLATELIDELVNGDTEDMGSSSSGTTSYLEDTSKSWDPNQWEGGYIEIQEQGIGTTYVRQILSNSTTRVYVYDSQSTTGIAWPSSFPGSSTWDYTLVARSEYRAVSFEGEEDFGIVSNVNGATIYDNTSTKSWSSGKWVGGYVMIFAGSDGVDNSSQCKKIGSSGSNCVAIEGSWSFSPDQCRYVLVEKSKMDVDVTGVHESWYYDSSSWSSLDPNCTTVRELWATHGASQGTYQGYLDDIRDDLQDDTSGPFSSSDFTEVPVLFAPGAVALLPNMVNLLNKDGTLYVPDPFGPRDGESSSDDLFKQHTSGIFVDDWVLHSGYGDIHCGTNIKREIPSTDWWDHY